MLYHLQLAFIADAYSVAPKIHSFFAIIGV